MAAPSDSSRCDSLTEQLLRAAQGDPDAFSEVYDAISGRVYGITLRVLTDPHQAEEVAQETLIEVWQKCANFDPDRGSAAAWISTMAHHRAVDRVRSSAATRRRDTTWHGDSGIDVGRRDTTFDEASAHARTRTIFTALLQLPPLQRRAIELAYYGGYTYADVARLMHTPVGTSKTRIRNALRLLRKNVDASLMDAVQVTR
jgi:RNA polymerase sigma-70 factor (ECF subfamily)